MRERVARELIGFEIAAEYLPYAGLRSIQAFLDWRRAHGVKAIATSPNTLFRETYKQQPDILARLLQVAA
jgi:tRNA G18 (ribose-2'-O)-methylase SpoU